MEGFRTFYNPEIKKWDYDRDPVKKDIFNKDKSDDESVYTWFWGDSREDVKCHMKIFNSYMLKNIEEFDKLPDKENFSYSNYYHVILRCKDCNKFYKLTLGEYHYFIDRNLSYPKRCKCCREKKRES